MKITLLKITLIYIILFNFICLLADWDYQSNIRAGIVFYLISATPIIMIIVGLVAKRN